MKLGIRWSLSFLNFVGRVSCFEVVIGFFVKLNRCRALILNLLCNVVSCHCVALDVEGRCYTWGRNEVCWQ